MMYNQIQINELIKFRISIFSNEHLKIEMYNWNHPVTYSQHRMIPYKTIIKERLFEITIRERKFYIKGNILNRTF